jgi:hypothetical protein
MMPRTPKITRCVDRYDGVGIVVGFGVFAVGCLLADHYWLAWAACGLGIVNVVAYGGRRLARRRERV